MPIEDLGFAAKIGKQVFSDGFYLVASRSTSIKQSLRRTCKSLFSFSIDQVFSLIDFEMSFAHYLIQMRSELNVLYDFFANEFFYHLNPQPGYNSFSE